MCRPLNNILVFPSKWFAHMIIMGCDIVAYRPRKNMIDADVDIIVVNQIRKGVVLTSS